MDSCVAISLILCTFGFMKELRPSEPFVTDYIVEHKNVTLEEVIHIAFPVSTYASLGSLAIILFVTDFLRYKPIVILEGVSHVLTWGILTFSSGLTAVIVAEASYGIACSSELAYSTYIYAQVNGEYYKRVTSLTHSARLAGKFFGGLAAQLLVTGNLMNYHQLNYVTLSCISVGVICTLFLPKVKINREYYLKTGPLTESLPSESEPLKDTLQAQSQPFNSLKHSLDEFVVDVKSAYGNSYVLKWSLWWAIASAGQYQVINYVQALWERVRSESESPEDLFNGAVKATHTFLSALLAFGFQFTNIKWEIWGERTLTIISCVQAAMLIWMASTRFLKAAYFSYVVFRTIHPVMITVASAEIAQKIRKESHGLIFGINMFVALSLQSVLTLLVSDRKGFSLDERSQYMVYGISFAILGFFMGLSTLASLFRVVGSNSTNQGSSQK